MLGLRFVANLEPAAMDEGSVLSRGFAGCWRGTGAEGSGQPVWIV